MITEPESPMCESDGKRGIQYRLRHWCKIMGLLFGVDNISRDLGVSGNCPPQVLLIFFFVFPRVKTFFTVGSELAPHGRKTSDVSCSIIWNSMMLYTLESDLELTVNTTSDNAVTPTSQ